MLQKKIQKTNSDLPFQHLQEDAHKNACNSLIKDSLMDIGRRRSSSIDNIEPFNHRGAAQQGIPHQLTFIQETEGDNNSSGNQTPQELQQDEETKNNGQEKEPQKSGFYKRAQAGVRSIKQKGVKSCQNQVISEDSNDKSSAGDQDSSSDPSSDFSSSSQQDRTDQPKLTSFIQVRSHQAPSNKDKGFDSSQGGAGLKSESSTMLEKSGGDCSGPFETKSMGNAPWIQENMERKKSQPKRLLNKQFSSLETGFQNNFANKSNADENDERSPSFFEPPQNHDKPRISNNSELKNKARLALIKTTDTDEQEQERTPNVGELGSGEFSQKVTPNKRFESSSNLSGLNVGNQIFGQKKGFGLNLGGKIGGGISDIRSNKSGLAGRLAKFRPKLDTFGGGGATSQKDFISNQSMKLQMGWKESKLNGFNSKYNMNDSKKLGEGAHAIVYECNLKQQNGSDDDGWNDKDLVISDVDLEESKEGKEGKDSEQEDHFDPDKPLAEKYKKEREIGREVTEQLNSLFNNTRRFAVKYTRSDDQEKLNAHEKEFRILERLNHENIVSGVELFKDEFANTIHQVLELVTGKELGQLVEEKGHLKEQEAKGIFIQILKGLRYLHLNQVCNRDIKPANILVTKDHQVTIVDFNVAKDMKYGVVEQSPLLKGNRQNESDSDSQISQKSVNDSERGKKLNKQSKKQKQSDNMQVEKKANSFVMYSSGQGTFAFQAPERLHPRPQYTEKVDIWSAGICLLYSLTGVLPFPSDNKDIVEDQILNQSQQIVKGILREHQRKNYLSSEAENLILQMMQVDPDLRLSASEAIKHSWFTHKSAIQKQQQKVKHHQSVILPDSFVPTPQPKKTENQPVQIKIPSFSNPANLKQMLISPEQAKMALERKKQLQETQVEKIEEDELMEGDSGAFDVKPQKSLFNIDSKPFFLHQPAFSDFPDFNIAMTRERVSSMRTIRDNVQQPDQKEDTISSGLKSKKRISLIAQNGIEIHSPSKKKNSEGSIASSSIGKQIYIQQTPHTPNSPYPSSIVGEESKTSSVKSSSDNTPKFAQKQASSYNATYKKYQVEQNKKHDKMKQNGNLSDVQESESDSSSLK